jgi:type II secretory pathway predicted ATPase ExeA
VYESFFGFAQKPFSLLPDPRFLYESRTHRMALTMLQYGLHEQAGFVVLTGEVGTGKTTLLRRLLHLVKDEVMVGLVTNTHQSFGELMKWILLAYDLDFKGRDEVERHQIFIDFLLARYGEGRRVVLIVDEAQNLGRDALEQLRMLSNVNGDADHLLQLILVGQPELRAMLQRPELRQFVQRIAIDYHLQPLSKADAVAYVRHRLATAGGDPELFDEEACTAVHFFAYGIPRLINSLCDLALVYAFAEDRPRIDIDTIIDVVDERTQSGGLAAFASFPLDLPKSEVKERILNGAAA